jgi:glycerophosphoryl diester phosphodiesterase
MEGYANEKIPLLSEVLALLPEDRLLVIEIKSGPEIIPHLRKEVDLHWKKGEISFIAFDLETILAMKKLYPEVPCYYLSMLGADVKKHIQSAVDGGLDGLDLRFGIINPRMMERCRAAGLEVWCWTVNDPETAEKMKKLGVSAVTTDRPAWLKKNMAKK